jgi:hypothetical protein
MGGLIQRFDQQLDLFQRRARRIQDNGLVIRPSGDHDALRRIGARNGRSK